MIASNFALSESTLFKRLLQLSAGTSAFLWRLLLPQFLRSLSEQRSKQGKKMHSFHHHEQQKKRIPGDELTDPLSRRATIGPG